MNKTLIYEQVSYIIPCSLSFSACDDWNASLPRRKWVWKLRQINKWTNIMRTTYSVRSHIERKIVKKLYVCGSCGTLESITQCHNFYKHSKSQFKISDCVVWSCGTLYITNTIITSCARGCWEQSATTLCNRVWDLSRRHSTITYLYT